MEVDAQDAEDFRGLEEQFDTVIMLNVLEHLNDAPQALANLWSALQPGGKAIVLVPQHPSLYGTLDEALEHHLRYTTSGFEQVLKDAGFHIEQMFDFNRFSAPGWWLNGKVLRRRKFSRVQLKLIDLMMPVIKRVDRLLPWSGVSLVAIAVKD
jgi:SAM-dependent methyltransferase